LDHKRRILEAQLVDLQEAMLSLNKSQDALQKMLEIYARDPDARTDALLQVEEATKKLDDLAFKRTRVKLLLDSLQEQDEDDL
jgi:hypothetical protein